MSWLSHFLFTLFIVAMIGVFFTSNIPEAIIAGSSLISFTISLLLTKGE
jgi:hypothetical protein